MAINNNHISIYIPKHEKTAVVKALDLISQRLFGPGSSKVSNYVVALIRKDFRERGIIKSDGSYNEERLQELEWEIADQIKDLRAAGML